MFALLLNNFMMRLTFLLRDICLFIKYLSYSDYHCDYHNIYDPGIGKVLKLGTGAHLRMSDYCAQSTSFTQLTYFANCNRQSNTYELNS